MGREVVHMQCMNWRMHESWVVAVLRWHVYGPHNLVTCY